MALTDTGLVVRYPFDEAASGDPTTVVDVSSNGYDLTATGTNVAANMDYTEVSGNRGLSCTSKTGNQRIVQAMGDSGDAVRTALAGGKAFTIELVLDPRNYGSSGTGRIIAITDRAGGNGDLAVCVGDVSNTWSVRYNGTSYTFENTNSGRQVLHIVIDTDQATQNDRIRWAYNGGSLTQIGGPASGTTLSIGTSRDLIMFNRESGGSFDRSIDMIVYYAAIYSSAFDATRITDHYDVLTADDDEPAGSTQSLLPIISNYVF